MGDKMETSETDIFFGITIYRGNGSTTIIRYTIDPTDNDILFLFNIRNEEERDLMLVHLVIKMEISKMTSTQIARYLDLSEQMVLSIVSVPIRYLELVEKPNTPSLSD
jgi:hypothetical protein